MKAIIAICFILIVTSTFTIQNIQQFSNKISQLRQHSQRNGCSSDQITTIYNAISLCEQQNMVNTILCMGHNILMSKFQYFNIFIRTQNSTDAVVYWPNTCVLDLNGYGKFNRYWKIWNAFSYQAKDQGKETQSKQIMNNLEQKNIIKYRQSQISVLGCYQNQLKAINSGLQVCDGNKNQEGALCLLNYLQKELGEKYNVYYAPGFYNGGSMLGIYYHLSICEISFDHYGAYDRRIQIWQAQ